MEMSNITARIRDQIASFETKEQIEEIGEVSFIGDGIARVIGLTNVMAGELVEFENGAYGMAQNLEKNDVGVIIFGGYENIHEGEPVKRTGRILDVPVGDALIGRVVDALGRPIDGLGAIETTKKRPVENEAPGVMQRQSVKQSLPTGLKVVDALVPIGKGQRELIIGDRKTGKTSIAVDAILNQKGKDTLCIYVAIGQKASTVAALVQTLREHGALPYSIIVSATAADPAAMQYYAPFAGAAIGEYFRDRGYSALVIYDDLSKQAVAYREVSLILRRPSGREAYPGDVFYLHSRLLERAARINNQQEIAEQMNDLPACMKGHVRGGGSLTALPIIETQAGDVSAYIPTNVISITDGQIYLETNLFNQGFRPAINVGISVSRVGGSAQIKSMKKVAGTLKLDMAQYRELEAFSKFSSDMDAVTAMTLDRGRKNNQLLIQPQYHPMPVGEQIAILYCGVHGLMHDVPVEAVRECQDLFLEAMRSSHADVISSLANGDLTDDSVKVIEETMANIAGQYK
ncbi:F0F1 ATP synthase subunit alpha [uncultured Granulicatella sp.]|uniref:F0F1 ATP synthase subunit alpha n=1 Tax=uncultured Granulicatella sp. TaxID=316089 RepID=UPI002608971D|nr:F0F1 ATP synthase subunit alpha [uncultured Granulicatella sp.]